MTINVLLATKFEIENINGKIDFNLWHIKMCAFLVQQGLLKALKGEDVLPATLSDEKKKISCNGHIEEHHNKIGLQNL